MKKNENNIIYFRKEMAYLYKMRELFVKKFPKVAPFLGVDSKDPDVERIIENVAILTSKIHQELDENMPLIAESLINIVAPNYTNPFPSSCIQEFSLKPDSDKCKITIPKGSVVSSVPVGDVKCKFKSVYDVTLYPLKIEKTYMSNNRADYVLNLEIAVSKEGLNLSHLQMDELSLYLGSDAYMSSTLLMWIKTYLKELVLFCPDSGEEFKLAPTCVSELGLDEKLIDYDDLGFDAFGVLQELFFAPFKFNFIAIKNLNVLKNVSTKSFVIKFIFEKDLPNGYIPRNEYFSLSATPVVNVFNMSAEPILNNHKRNGYRIFLDRNNINSYEIVQVLKVIAHSSDTGRRVLKNYKSFERFKFLNDEQNGEFYSLSDKTDASLNSYKEISFFSGSGNTETITIDTLCCNGNLSSKLKISDINEISNFKEVTTKNITVPTAMQKISVDGNLLWKLVSILSFSYQTLLDKNSFLAVLDAFSFDKDKGIAQILTNAITDIRSKSIYRISEAMSKKGTLCIFYIDEGKFYSLGEVYVSGLALSKFLSSFASVNSFCEVKVKCVNSGIVINYPMSNGKKALI